MILTLLGFACVPDLYTPEGQLDDGGDWEAPDNDWPLATPPSGLEAEGFAQGEVAPDMRLHDQHGDEVSLWQFYGSVIVIDVSTMWCGPCKTIASEVDDTWYDYKDDGFMYLTLLPENESGQVPSQDDLNEWADDYGISAPVLADDQGFGYQIEPNGRYPTLMVLDRELKVVEDRVEPAEDAVIRALIESEL